ncbi:hypothetical protein EVAR_94646_1 [Eumeta japonica]|uniref:Histone-lysine N-methyltransferase SETMAR n=1 Tax=Eumeta variegata TaxID=151549 RepID=A0A4C1UUZ2_EUMVA|nr:hypothetical protein EVAR_94646_1 [Eumeta japonica]
MLRASRSTLSCLSRRRDITGYERRQHLPTCTKPKWRFWVPSASIENFERGYVPALRADVFRRTFNLTRRMDLKVKREDFVFLFVLLPRWTMSHERELKLAFVSEKKEVQAYKAKPPLRPGTYIRHCSPGVLQTLRIGSLKLHHDDASSHTAALTVKFLKENDIEVLEHPPYSPDVAVNDFWLFFNLKT